MRYCSLVYSEVSVATANEKIYNAQCYITFLLLLDRSCSYWLLTVHVLLVNVSTGVIKSVEDVA